MNHQPKLILLLAAFYLFIYLFKNKLYRLLHVTFDEGTTQRLAD